MYIESYIIVLFEYWLWISLVNYVKCHLLSMQQIKVDIKSLAGSWEVLLRDALDPYLVGNHMHMYISPGAMCRMLLNWSAAL